VARLSAPEWKSYPAGQYFSNLYQKNVAQAKEEIFKNFQEIAQDLIEVGINVNCAPVLDILTEKTHQVIGDRAYGNNAKQVADLGQKVCDGLLSQGVYPVIKHIPGHGRGLSDSHLELPIVDATLQELRASDFAVFEELRAQKFAMTAHILFSAIDKINCATVSKTAINLIRNEIGFKNILMSDDISTGDGMEKKIFSNSFKRATSAESSCAFTGGCVVFWSELSPHEAMRILIPTSRERKPKAFFLYIFCLFLRWLNNSIKYGLSGSNVRPTMLWYGGHPK
jgi:beta-N-acetylhexosaminidase